MLLAALLRADGIPSRVCTGVVYSESAAVQESADPHQHMGGGNTQSASLVWHMWSQALINGRWHDLDATLDVPFHGGHILTSTSSMVDILSLRSSELEMMKLIGALEVSTTHHCTSCCIGLLVCLTSEQLRVSTRPCM
jgi:hypothetical protein